MATIDWTYAVTDSADSSALEGVHIWATSDIEGLTVVDTGTTDSNGEVSLSVTDGEDYYLWHALNGYTFTNPNLQTAEDGVDGSGEGTAIVAPVPDAVRIPYTVLNLISDSLIECGILGQGEDATDDDAQDALRTLNRVVEACNMNRILIYKVQIDQYTLTADQQIHSIGPSGDFLDERPTRVTKANIIVTDSNDDEIRYRLRIIEKAREWANVTNQDITASIPTHLYYEPDYPDGNLYLWPIPSVAYDLELFTWIQITKFKTLTEVINLPPGYYDFLMLTLSEKLCTRFGVPATTRQLISADASIAKKRIQDINMRSPLVGMDTGIPQVEGL